jgi:hypothetical protein
MRAARVLYCAAPSRCRLSLAVRRPGLISSALRKSAIAPGLVVIGQTASRLALEQFHHPAIAPAARIRPRQLGDLFVCRFASTASRP